MRDYTSKIIIISLAAIFLMTALFAAEKKSTSTGIKIPSQTAISIQSQKWNK